MKNLTKLKLFNILIQYPYSIFQTFSKMSPPTYEQNKIHIYKYRITHPEVVKRIAKEAQKKNMPKILEYNKGRYRYQQECKKFRNILIDQFEPLIKDNSTNFILDNVLLTCVSPTSVSPTSVSPNNTLPSQQKRSRKKTDNTNFIIPIHTLTPYEKNKQYIYNWRKKNKETYDKKNTQYVLSYYYKNKKRLNAKRLGYFHYAREAKLFRNILIAFYG